MFGLMRVEFEHEDNQHGIEVRIEVTFPPGKESEASGIVLDAASAVSSQVQQGP